VDIQGSKTKLIMTQNSNVDNIKLNSNIITIDTVMNKQEQRIFKFSVQEINSV